MENNVFFQPILLWVQENPNWSGLVVFTISFLESLVGPGFFIPGVFFMSSIGALVGAGVLSLWPTLTYAVIGAVVGDYASFWIGWRYKNKIRQWWFFKKYPRVLARGYAFFRKHGGKSVVLGRFVGPVRPMIPVIAGMMRMPPKHFLLANVVSALLWAPFYSSPGYFLGASLNDFSLEIVARICAYLLTFILLIWVLQFGYKRTIASIVHIAHRLLQKEWLALDHLPYASALKLKLKDRRFSHHRGQILQLNFLIISLLCFGFCLFSIMTKSGLFHMNDTLYHFFRAAHVLKLELFFTFVTKFGEIAFLKYPLILVSIYLFLKRKWAVLAHGTLLIGLLYATAKLTKMLVMHPRPNGIMGTLDGFSFPSGHTVLATGILGFLAFVTARDMRARYRFLPILTWLFATAMVMLSRLYLGAHWALDVLSGFFLSTCLLLLLNIHYQNVSKDRLPIRECASLFLIGSLLGYIMQITNNNLEEDYKKYLLTFTETPTTFNAWQHNTLPNVQTRIDVFGNFTGPFNLQVLDEPQHLKALLNAHGWMLRPKFKLSHTAQWFSAHPNPEHVPTFPLFHQDRLAEISLIKVQPDCVYGLTLWRSGFTIQGKPLMVGRVSQLKRTHPLPLVTIYEGQLLEPTEIKLDTFFQRVGFTVHLKHITSHHNDNFTVLQISRSALPDQNDEFTEEEKPLATDVDQ